MKPLKSFVLTFLLAALLTGSISAAPAIAQSDFYKGKTITVYIGTTAGALYDQVRRRFFATHMNKHIPGNPNIIVQNMPGAAAT